MRLWLNLSLMTALALLAVHEMDAMTHAEWRLLPILSGMEGGLARDVFVWLHIPLYIGLFWALFHASWRARAGMVFSGAMVLHAIVHFLLSDHALYSFAPPIETVTVYGAALSGLIYIALSIKGTQE